MKNMSLVYAFILVFLAVILVSCEAIGAIFSTGVGVGIFIAVFVVVIIVAILLRAGKK